MNLPLQLIVFFRSWWKAVVAFLVAAPLFFLLGQCDGKKIERRNWQAKIARVEAAAEKKQREADAARAELQRLENERITANRKEVDDAVAPIPDQAPTARQRARACVELRRQAAAAGKPEPAC
ncbi:MAG TPA: hypothetical protein VD768_08860 [Sphingomicrobium sp.]|nr:hypothetical protein [Sphingomicrobium sp.]